MSKYGGTDVYTYADSDVLRNKGDFRSQEALDAFEADITAVRMLELYEQPISGRFDLQHLQAIHRHLFQDIYDWAGLLRTVDISKGESRFAHCSLIADYLGKQLDCLSSESLLRGLPPQAFVERLAHYMGEINAAHPFRDGNGRAQRAFCAQLAEQAGYFIGFDEVGRDEMLAAMIASFRGENRLLVELLDGVVARVDAG